MQPSSFSEAEPTMRRQVIFFGLSGDEAEIWAAVAAQQDVDFSVASTVSDCEVLSRTPAPTVVVAHQRVFDRRLVDRTDEGLRRTAAVLLLDDIAEAGAWQLVAWEALAADAPDTAVASALESALAEARHRLADCQLVDDYHQRRAKLSADEVNVFEAVCAGRLNKQIASDLNVSVRTIEQRRRRVFDKMGVESAVPLSALQATVRTIEDNWRRRFGHQAPEPPPATGPTPGVSRAPLIGLPNAFAHSPGVA